MPESAIIRPSWPAPTMPMRMVALSGGRVGFREDLGGLALAECREGVAKRRVLAGEDCGREQGGIASHVLNELDITCFPDDLPEFIEVDLSNLTVGHSLHVRELALPKGVELALHKSENPVVATVVIPSLITEEEEAAAAAAAVAPSEVPTTEQAAAPKEGEGAPAEGEKGDKGKGGGAAEKPAPADKGEKKDKK